MEVFLTKLCLMSPCEFYISNDESHQLASIERMLDKVYDININIKYTIPVRKPIQGVEWEDYALFDIKSFFCEIYVKKPEKTQIIINCFKYWVSTLKPLEIKVPDNKLDREIFFKLFQEFSQIASLEK